MKKKWWEEGVRFECQGSGQCCLSRGEYGFVYLTLKDRQRLAKHFKIPTRRFTEQYCTKHNGYFCLREESKRSNCMFLLNNKCSVYRARPVQCRTWPFWPEVMGAKAWAKEVAAFCPGVGKGKIIPANEIRKQLEIQKKSEEQL